MPMYEGGAGTTAPYPEVVDDPRTVKPMLETQLDEALTHIKNIDAQIAEYRTKRETYVSQACEARVKLIEKCDSAKCLLDKPKSVTPSSYMPSI